MKKTTLLAAAVTAMVLTLGSACDNADEPRDRPEIENPQDGGNNDNDQDGD